MWSSTVHIVSISAQVISTLAKTALSTHFQYNHGNHWCCLSNISSSLHSHTLLWFGVIMCLILANVLWMEVSCFWARVCWVGTLRSGERGVGAALLDPVPKWLKLTKLLYQPSGWVAQTENKTLKNFHCFKPLKFWVEN